MSRTAVPAFLLSLLTAVLPVCGGDDSPDLASHRAAYAAARAAGDLTTALEAAEEAYWITAEPHIESLYTLAATNAAAGNREEAYDWLQKALDAGLWNFKQLRTDEDFAGIREDERFRTMVRAAWARQYIEMLERDEREAFQQPDRVMATLAIRPGERVAEVGAGSGYFTVRVARAVGTDGFVVATDIRQEMLDYLEERLRHEGLENVRLVLAPGDDPSLPDAGLDTILMIDVWHYIRDPSYAKKLRAALAPGGRLVIIDYRPKPFDERPWGPPPVQQTPRAELDAHMAEAGLKPVRVHEYLEEQYFVEYAAD